MIDSLNTWFKNEKKWLMSIGILVEKIDCKQSGENRHIKVYLSTEQNRGIITLGADSILHLEVNSRDVSVPDAPKLKADKDLSAKFYADWTVILNRFILCMQNVSHCL